MGTSLLFGFLAVVWEVIAMCSQLLSLTLIKRLHMGLDLVESNVES